MEFVLLGLVWVFVTSKTKIGSKDDGGGGGGLLWFVNEKSEGLRIYGGIRGGFGFSFLRTKFWNGWTENLFRKNAWSLCSWIWFS